MWLATSKGVKSEDAKEGAKLVKGEVMELCQ